MFTIDLFSRKLTKYLLMAIVIVGPSSHISAKTQQLGADEAFIPTVEMMGGSITATWKIAEGYYLYKEKFDFRIVSGDGVTLGKAEFPKGKIKNDKYFGTQEVYQNEVTVRAPVEAVKAGDFSVKVKYQGCADRGVCYSPKRKTYDFHMQAPTLTSSGTGAGGLSAVEGDAAAAVVQTEESRMTSLLKEGHLLTIVGVFFLGGLALTFTPCVLPMVPILSSIIVGQKKELSKSECFALSLSYVIGMATTYAILGVVLGVAGKNVTAYMQSPWVISVFAGLFVLLSLSMFGLYELRLPQGIQTRLNSLNDKQQGGTYLGTLIMGVLSALVVSPCVSAPLAGALVYISTTDGGATLGGAALFALGMGMGAPLLVIGTGGAHLIPSAGTWMVGVKAFFGVMLLAVAIWFLDRILPSTVTMVLWGALLLGAGIYLGGLDFGKKEGWGQIGKTAGFISVLYGTLMFIGAASGGTNPLQPLETFGGVGVAKVDEVRTSDINAQFVTVSTIAELKSELASAQKLNQPVFLDFYADWCASCKVMEHEVFPDPEIESRLQPFYLIRADVTNSDEMLKRYDLFGPPSLLFFSDSGEELTKFHVRSEIHAEELAAHLDSVIHVVQRKESERIDVASSY